MATMSIHQDTPADRIGASGMFHTCSPGRCFLTVSVGPDDVSIHFADMASMIKLYQHVGNVVAQLQDERAQGDRGIDLSTDSQAPGGIVGIQPGNPTMDAHGPRQRVAD